MSAQGRMRKPSLEQMLLKAVRSAVSSGYSGGDGLMYVSGYLSHSHPRVAVLLEHLKRGQMPAPRAQSRQ